jgi:chromosomal replication initiator protein
MFDALLARGRGILRRDEPWVALPEQQFAQAALARLKQPADGLDRPGTLTVLSGSTGGGKSLLIRQALRELTRGTPRTRFLILDADDWGPAETADESPLWTWAEETGPAVDVVVCEDLDRILHDHAWSDRLARWLEGLAARQVRVVLTLSRWPARIPEITPRLLSRLHAGLLVRLPEFSVESRRRFLIERAAAVELAFSDAVLELLVEGLPNSPRKWQAAIDRLGQEFPPPVRLNDPAAVQRVLFAPTTPRLALATITQRVAEEFGVSAIELRTPSRVLTCRLPRQCAMHLAHSVGGWSMAEIGRFFGQRTHTSVSYSCRKFQEHLTATPALRDRLQRLHVSLKRYAVGG